MPSTRWSKLGSSNTIAIGPPLDDNPAVRGDADVIPRSLDAI